MNKFIKQLLVFLIPIFILILSVIFLQLYSINQIKNYNIPKSVNKLVMGDSHTKLAVDDSILANSLNISQYSMSYLYSYFVLKELLSNNKKIDSILLSCSEHNFASYYDESTYHSEIIGKYFFLLPFETQLILLDSTKNSLAVFKESYLNFISNYFSNSLSFIGDYDNVHSDIRISEEYINKRIKKQYGHKNKILYSELNKKYFLKIKKLCDEFKIELIIIKTPLNEKYVSKLPHYIKNYYNNFIKDFNLIEYEINDLNDIDFMPDGDHLNRSGAIKYSNYLNEKLKNN